MSPSATIRQAHGDHRAEMYQATRMILAEKDGTMQRISPVLRTFGVVTFLGLASLALLPLPAHAGGVHVSFGFGLPVPVVVAPQPVYVPPAPVVVEPGVVYTHSYYESPYRDWRPRHYGYWGAQYYAPPWRPHYHPRWHHHRW